MMTQTAPEGEPHFVITMAEHTELCGQLARAFGNDHFERLDPFEEIVYVVETMIAAGTATMQIRASTRRHGCPTSWRERRLPTL
jgi:hypothetical protein